MLCGSSVTRSEETAGPGGGGERGFADCKLPRAIPQTIPKRSDSKGSSCHTEPDVVGAGREG